MATPPLWNHEIGHAVSPSAVSSILRPVTGDHLFDLTEKSGQPKAAVYVSLVLRLSVIRLELRGPERGLPRRPVWPPLCRPASWWE